MLEKDVEERRESEGKEGNGGMVDVMSSKKWCKEVKYSKWVVEKNFKLEKKEYAILGF